MLALMERTGFFSIARWSEVTIGAVGGVHHALRLWPERVEALVTGNSYNILNIPRSWDPLPAAEEAALWYQYYFHSERAARARAELAPTSPDCSGAMCPPDLELPTMRPSTGRSGLRPPGLRRRCVPLLRHRFGLVPGDPAYAHIETRLIAPAAYHRCSNHDRWRRRRRIPGTGASWFDVHGAARAQGLPSAGHDLLRNDRRNGRQPCLRPRRWQAPRLSD